MIMLMSLVLLLSACVADKGGNTRRRTTATNLDGGEGDPNKPKDPVFSGASEVVWFSEKEIPGNLIINENTDQAVYLRGPAINRYLSLSNNFNRLYCLVVSFNDVNPTSKRNLRARALPITITNISQGSIERLLRIDVSQSADNQAVCGGQAYALNLGQLSPDLTSTVISSVQAAFTPQDLCPTCSGLIVSSHVALYQTRAKIPSGFEIDTSTFIPLSSIDMRGLGLRIDTQSNVQDDAGSCTNAGCAAKGFDCCLEGQCVKDRTEKPNAPFNSQYLTAMEDVRVNPARFVNYPEIFYICPNIVNPTPPVEPIPDPEEEARRLFERDRDDYLCLEEAKKEQPEFGTLGLDRCQDLSQYITVRNQVWKRCGCRAEPFPTRPDEPACPDFGLRALLDERGDIKQVVCDVPDPNIEPIPFQFLNVRVPNRTAPHRFFDSLGTQHDDLEKARLLSPQPVQEGEPFSYLDESGKTDPIDAPFSMNAIMGQFTLTLNRALPAKVIYVEFDQTYIIAARSGFYTPCPQCAKDSWFEAFTAHPASQRGTGLQATGYSTSRDTYSNNNTNGNYEDTIFGRACWVPPTMLPFTHRSLPDLNAQRRNRMETQAALYVNGYQRDWFGFNKGALIGSFDGVKWFAIGKGRKVQATSQKLYLAINAPFADLTENTDTIVEVIADQNNFDAVAEMDYDPELALSDARQNSAGTCQHYHQCSVDSDCVSKLGWEYACADIQQFRTNWPKFDINGRELAGDQISLANFTQFLQGPFPQDNGKRCVYRGAGAPCKRDYNSNLDSKMKKQFTCAPNFYCASLGDNSFNNRLVRTPNLVEFILFGQDADILGRPLNYVGAQQNLTDNIRANIEANGAAISSLSSDFGVCRPGRSLASSNPIEQHRSSDIQQRTDYINQIASCDASALDSARTQSCPAIETRSGQAQPVGDFILNNSATDLRMRALQNMCGKESQRQTPTGLYESTFKAIEALPIRSLADLLSPTLTQDACLRRAGSICHTDLDCSPNKLHSEQALFFGINAFGNTSAEQKFWSESLVCSQATPQPFLQSENYFDYDLTQNRCCRPVGQELSMYTQSNNLTITPDLGAENLGLVTDRLPSTNPRATGRYSRYSVVDLDTPASFPAPRVQSTVNPRSNQWKTINKTGELNCCGGGFIRKFADGTNDWTQTNRFNISPENFTCLNYSNPQVFGYNGVGNVNNFNRDYDRLCRAPADGGCVQVPIPQASGFEIQFPSLYNPSFASISTRPIGDLNNSSQQVSNFSPFQPTPYIPIAPHNRMSVTQGPFNYLGNPTFLPATSFYLPLYITGRNMIARVFVEYVFGDGSVVNIQANPYAGSGACPGPLTFPSPAGPSAVKNPRDALAPDNNVWCVDRDPNGAFDLFHLRGDPNFTSGGEPWVVAGVRIEYLAPGSTNYVTLQPATPQALNPGNDFYYVTKLGRLELLGIPQIFYEPLYCNTDRNRLVPGLFKQSTRLGFEANSLVYNPAVNGGRFLEDLYHVGAALGFDPSNTDGSLNSRVVYQDQINLPQIFSGHEFKCCQKLGQKVASQDQCCSGYAPREGDDMICKLPSGTNLNVYFNRFVSSEGVGEEAPGGGLVDDDFIPETGEPKARTATLEKLSALGFAHCELEEIRRGSSNGNYYGEPFSGFYQQDGDVEQSRIYSIVDSNLDADPANDTGHLRFLEGLRWSHHLYCD